MKDSFDKTEDAESPARALPDRPGSTLTRRETEVLRQLAHGRTLRMAAAALGVSPHTVHTHVKHIYQKLDISGRAQARVAAVRLGLVDA